MIKIELPLYYGYFIEYTFVFMMYCLTSPWIQWLCIELYVYKIIIVYDTRTENRRA